MQLICLWGSQSVWNQWAALSAFTPFNVPREITTEVNNFLLLFNLLSEGLYRFTSSAKKWNPEGRKKRECHGSCESGGATTVRLVGRCRSRHGNVGADRSAGGGIVVLHLWDLLCFIHRRQNVTLFGHEQKVNMLHDGSLFKCHAITSERWIYIMSKKSQCYNFLHQRQNITLLHHKDDITLHYRQDAVTSQMEYHIVTSWEEKMRERERKEGSAVTHRWRLNSIKEFDKRIWVLKDSDTCQSEWKSSICSF